MIPDRVSFFPVVRAGRRSILPATSLAVCSVTCNTTCKVACMTHHGTGLRALTAVKRLEVAMADAFVVETDGPPMAWDDVMQWYGDILAAGEAKPVPEEEV